MTQAVNMSECLERIEKALHALEQMRLTWKSGVPARRWGYARILERLLCRAGHG